MGATVGDEANALDFLAGLTAAPYRYDFYQTLRRLETLGLVERHDYREVPPRVEYTLTERGWSLSPLILALDRWVETHAFAMLPAGTSAQQGVRAGSAARQDQP